MANQYELIYKLGAELTSQFKSSFSQATSAVKDMATSVSSLANKSADTSKLVKLRKEIENNSQAYQQQKARVEELQRQLNGLHGSDSKMAKALEDETQKLEKAKLAMLSQSRTAEELSRKLNLTGVSTSDLEKRQERLTSALQKVGRIQERLGKVNSKLNKINSEAVSSMFIASMTIRRTYSLLADPIKSAVTMEEVMRNLGDTLNIRSPEALAQMQKQFEDMSMTIPVAKENLAAMYAMAKQNGIGGDLSQFTEQAAKFATILKVDGKEAVTMFTDWNAKLSQTTEETFKLANATVMLSNHNSDFAKSIGQTVLAVGEYAQRAGLAAKQTAAIAAAMVSTGSSAEDAAMGIKQMLKVMGSGDAMTKGQISAFQTIGLGDPKKLQAELQKDASGVMLNVLRKVRDTIPQGEQLSLLEQMFGGKQAGKTILPMMRNLDALAANFEKVANSENYASAMQDEFNSRMENTSNILDLAKNAWDNFITMIGEPLLGPLKDVLKTFVEYGKVFGNWMRENRELVGIITKVAVALAGFVATIHVVRAAALFLTAPILTTYKSFLLLQRTMVILTASGPGFAAVMTKIGVAVKAVGVAMKAMFLSPMGLAVTTIAGLVAAGVLLYKNWDKIKAYLDGLWKAFEEHFPGMAKVVSQFYENSIKPIVDGIKTTFQGLIDFVTSVFSGNWQKTWEGIKSVFAGIWQSLSGIIKGPINAMITAINYVIKGVNSLGSFSVPDWVPGVGGKAVGINIPEIPKLAQGGIVSSPTTAMVGEGREPEAVMPLSRLAGMLGSGMGQISMNYSSATNTSEDGLQRTLRAHVNDFI